MNQIRQYFAKLVSLTEKDWEFFSAKLIWSEFPKKTLLLKAGKTENYLSFIEKGIIRFYIPQEDNDLTFGFAFNNSFVSAYDSFLTQTTSAYHVETISETILVFKIFSNSSCIFESGLLIVQVSLT